MNYDLTIEYKDGRVSMRFLGIDFFALDKVFGTMPIKRLSNYCFGIFNPKQEEPIYIQSSDDNIAEIISVPITNLHSLIEFFRNIPDREDFSIYKLGVDFNYFSILYDDDCMLVIEGKCSDKTRFQFFNRLYREICDTLENED
jgi:hypothetical protein